MKILVVEDYAPVRRSLTKGLREQAFAVDAAKDGAEGLWYAQSSEYDGILLDLMLPKVSGMDLLQQLRQQQNRTPVLILTAKDTLKDRLAGLDLGADDYLVKPFAFDEVVARIRALIRRKYGQTSPVTGIADLEVDTTQRVLRRNGRMIEVTNREFAIVEYLAYRSGDVVDRTAIWDHVYDFRADPNSNVIDVYIGHLRRKLEHGGLPRLIHTRRGLGYVLESRS